MTLTDTSYGKKVEKKIKRLEHEVKQLSVALEALTALCESKGVKARFPEMEHTGLSNLFFTTPLESNTPTEAGAVKADEFAGHKTLQLSASNDAHLILSTQVGLYMKAGRHISIHTPAMHVETSKLDIDGELAAKPAYTQAFTWRSGMAPVRLVHHRLGLPVLTRLESKQKNNSSLGAHLYIDERDGYWYLRGKSDEACQAVAEAVCFGRV